MKLEEAGNVCVALGQAELAERLVEAREALGSGDVRLYRKRIETVRARLGHIKESRGGHHLEYESSLALQIAMGLGLASCAGLRAFLPLFLVGVAARLGWVTLGSPFGWLGSWPALVVFGVAVVAEFLADKIPVIDHLLDVLHLLVKPAAGALLAVAVLTRLDPPEATVLGILTGGGTAGAVHAAKAKLRMLSSFTTAGLANPLLSHFF